MLSEKRWIVKDQGKYHIVGNTSRPLYEEVYECPDELEDVNDLVFLEHQVEGEPYYTYPAVDEQKKAARLAQKALEEADKQERLYSAECVELGFELIKHIHYVNEKKGITTEQLLTLATDPAFQQLKWCLETGSLATARGAIAMLNFPLYTQEDKQYVIDQITALRVRYGKEPAT